MDQILATKPVWCGKVIAIQRIVDENKLYVIQGIGLNGNLTNEVTFLTLEDVLEAFNRIKSS